MSKSSLLAPCLALLIVPLVFPSVAGAIAYTPAVSPGQFARYRVLYERCQFPDPMICQTYGLGLGDTDYSELEVVDVSGPSVTLNLVIVYKNGTSTREGVLVNVDTGASNFTSFTGTPTNYFVLAGGLQAPDPIWNAYNAPTFNQTASRTVLGAARDVNYLNFSSSTPVGEYSISSSSGFAYDRQSGMLIEIAFSYSSSFGNTAIEFAIGMVDNNIWLPGFTISNLGSISFQTGSTGTTTITFTALNGFSSTVNLEVSSTPSGLTCSTSQNSISTSRDVTLTCQGLPGNYTVTVTATSGSKSRTTQVPVQVNTATVTEQPTGNETPFLLYAGLAVVAAIAIAMVALFLSRRTPRAVPEPTAQPDNPIM